MKEESIGKFCDVSNCPDMENFRYRIFDEYGDVVLSRTFSDIPRPLRIYFEEILDLVFYGTDFDIDREVF